MAGSGVHIPLRFLRVAMKKGISFLKTRAPAAPQQAKQIFEPVYARLPTANNSLHSAQRQRIGGRWYSTSVKNFLRYTVDTTTFRIQRPGVGVRAALHRSPAAPFASTLRPKLVGGAFPRSAGGYSLGGNGARYFSSSPAGAQVMSQVSAAMRAFIHSSKGQFDAYRRHDGELGSIGVRAQLAASLAESNAPGAYIDFDLSPTMTSISPFHNVKNTLENEEFLDSLSADFGNMVGTLTVIYADIRRLSTLGDLPVSLTGPSGDVLRIRFPGCDAEFVEQLCDEVGVRRGVVHEDERFAFGQLAPGLAPSWKDMMNDSPPLSSTYSEDGYSDIRSDDLSSDESGDVGDYFYREPDCDLVMVDSPGLRTSSAGDSGDYGGLEGIHRFLEECDEYRSGLSAWR